MASPVRIDPAALYDDASLHLGAGLSFAALAKARKVGTLRYTRRGGSTLYLGQWILDWLCGDGAPTSSSSARLT